MSYEPTVMRKALARLERRKDNRERRRYELERELYARQPRLRQIDADLRGTMADLALLAAGGRPIRADGPEIAAIRARSEALQAERARLLADMGYGADALDDVPACPRCGDRGWGDDGTMCVCLKELCAQEQIKVLTALLNLTDEQDFDRLRLDVYSDQPWNGDRSPREYMKQVAAVCEGYARQFPNYPLKNLLLSGGTGLGKTFLSGCIAREVSRRGYSVVYDTAASVFDSFDGRRFPRDPEQGRQAREDTRRYLSCDLMILDDLGSEQNLPSARASLYELVNSRLQSGRHTIISSNLSTREIGAEYGAQLASRLQGLYRELTFYGEDLRLKGW